MIRQQRLRDARREAERPEVLDPLLDSTRVLRLAQKLAREIVNGPEQSPEAQPRFEE